MRNTTFGTYTRFAALLTAVAATCIGTAYAGDREYDQEQLAQITELQNLHATFHAAVSVHDPVNPDSAEVITQRIQQALSIFAEDAMLTVVGTTNTAGNYIGRGDPDDPATCPEPTHDTSAGGNRAHCAHSLSMSPERFSRGTGLFRSPLTIRPSLSLCGKTGSGHHRCILSATTSTWP